MSVEDLYITPQRLAEMANEVAARFPDAMLYKSGNDTGNLVIHQPIGDTEYEYVGLIDLKFGEVTVFGDDEKSHG